MNLQIVLFDDIEEHREALLAALREALGKGGEAKPFSPGTSTEGVFEERLVADLNTPPNSPVDLIIADRDLSAFSTEYRGLSESTVRRAADKIGVPECGYARGERDDDDEYVKRGDLRESCIRLSRKPDDATFARRAIAVGQGFIQIASRLREIKDPTIRKTPGRLLAEVLSKAEYSEKISLYASGDQNRLGALEIVREQKNPNVRNRLLACVLGYWLWDSVLRFPGVVVNEVAASSYLNIHLEDFQQENVKGVFAAARYNGPFAEAKASSLWWRGMLDDLIADSRAADGREYAKRTLDIAVSPSQCCEDPDKPAGYYCFLSERPVSLGNSKPGLPWFPRGADLARVCKSRFAEDEPWL